MAQYYSGPISQLPPSPNPVLGSNIYPATDVTDLTSSPSGTTYKYTIAELATFLSNTIIGSNVESVRMSSTVNLNAIYDNGPNNDGIGATLVNAGANATLVLDGVTASTHDRVLIKDQASALENGIYSVTVAGDSMTAWVLTRTADYDDSSRIPEFGDFVGVVEGTLNDLTFWFQVTPNPISIGFTSIVWEESQSSASSLTWNLVPGTSQLVSSNMGYITQNGSLTTFTLPSLCPVGFSFQIEGIGAGGWMIQAGGSQYLRMISSLSNAGGTASSNGQYDGCSVVCVTENVEFKIISAGSAKITLA